MFFLIGFGWHVAASFAFVLAILSPNWLTVQTVPSLGSFQIQRGVFYVCDLVAQNSTFTTTRCASIIGVDSSLISTGRWNYNFAISSAAIAIGCAGLSIIVLWLSGIYFNVRKKNSCTTCFLLSICLLLLLTFCASFVVWILLISETLTMGYSVNRSIFNWPMWLAVGATGGYLMALLTMLFSFCAVVCHGRKEDRSLNYAANKF
ncbi:unnamed protein product [Adineta steineri]|uniref:Uncharacterized protein n=1 Tax=Adineta steineri TaxID=433720 RepID=A0A815EC70_9BILA|nr:unnamed protein product [Adineta steineri]CAF3602951.1 unnamed protein product [Adineta steineri]